MVDIEQIERELREGLEGVTPGPWHAVQMYQDRTEDRPFVVGPSDVVVGTDGICEPDRMNYRSFVEDAANMRHIARCDPDTIRALLARLREVEATATEQCAAVVESFIPLCGSEFGETTKLRKQALLRDVANAVRALRESLPTAGGETK